MLIKWKFGFGAEHLVTEVRDEAIDQYISQEIESGKKLLAMIINGARVYINLDSIQLIVREEAEENVDQVPSDSQPTTVEIEQE